MVTTSSFADSFGYLSKRANGIYGHLIGVDAIALLYH